MNFLLPPCIKGLNVNESPKNESFNLKSLNTKQFINLHIHQFNILRSLGIVQLLWKDKNSAKYLLCQISYALFLSFRQFWIGNLWNNYFFTNTAFYLKRLMVCRTDSIWIFWKLRSCWDVTHRKVRRSMNSRFTPVSIKTVSVVLLSISVHSIVVLIRYCVSFYFFDLGSVYSIEEATGSVL